MNKNLKLKYGHEFLNFLPEFRKSRLMEVKKGSVIDSYSKTSPNFQLLLKNTLLESIEQEDRLTLIHVTTSLGEIRKSGCLYPSGGALGACIYGVPLRANGELHNLSEYIYRHELPETLKRKGINNRKVDLLAIVIDLRSVANIERKIIGVDFVRFGELRIKAFQDLIQKKLISNSDRVQIEKLIEEKMRAASPLFLLCSNKKALEEMSFTDFKSILETTLDNVKELRTIYFETLLEYIFLFQNDSIVTAYRQKGEFYNRHFKDAIYQLCPELYLAFKLTVFNPDLSIVTKYLEDKSRAKLIITDFSSDHFRRFMKLRIAEQIKLKILEEKTPSSNFRYNDIIMLNPCFAGHIIHRNIGNIHAYESKMAELLWKYWRVKQFMFTVYSPIPKGEVGINPASTELKYNIYRVDLDKFTNKVKFTEKLNIKIVPKLIKPQFGIMRAPHKTEDQ